MRNSGWPYSTGWPFSTRISTIVPVGLGLDLVHQLHRLDDADDLALAHRLADLDEGRRLGRRRAIEGADEGRGDERPGALGGLDGRRRAMSAIGAGRRRRRPARRPRRLRRGRARACARADRPRPRRDRTRRRCAPARAPTRSRCRTVAVVAFARGRGGDHLERPHLVFLGLFLLMGKRVLSASRALYRSARSAGAVMRIRYRALPRLPVGSMAHARKYSGRQHAHHQRQRVGAQRELFEGPGVQRLQRAPRLGDQVGELHRQRLDVGQRAVMPAASRTNRR